MMVRKRRDVAPTALTDHFVMHSYTLRTSPGWRALPDNARRIVMALEEEHMRYGGTRNGRLALTYKQLSNKAGVRLASVSLAIRQACAVRLVEVTRVGHLTENGAKFPSTYRLTHVWSRKPGEKGSAAGVPATDEWRQIATDEEARAVLEAARPPPRKRPPRRTIVVAA
jgi:hypothetical protein